MLLQMLVLGVASVLILWGAFAELAEAWRDRKTVLSEEEALRALRRELGDVSLIGWAALAAIALLAPSLWRSSQLPGSDVLLLVFVLGLAANRASYLLRARAMPNRAAAVVVGTGTVLAGLAIGITA